MVSGDDVNMVLTSHRMYGRGEDVFILRSIIFGFSESFFQVVAQRCTEVHLRCLHDQLWWKRVGILAGAVLPVPVLAGELAAL